jgi:hypothetical protein
MYPYRLIDAIPASRGTVGTCNIRSHIMGDKSPKSKEKGKKQKTTKEKKELKRQKAKQADNSAMGATKK